MGTRKTRHTDGYDDFSGDEEAAVRRVFADPGGNSALRAAGRGNPRNLPCPNCREPNKITPADKRRHYVCDACADAAERGY